MIEYLLDVIEETSDYLLVEVEASNESSAIEQAENWCKAEGLDVTHIARISGEGLKRTTGSQNGTSPGGVFGLYYYLKIDLARSIISSQEIKLEQVKL